jgi:hypothetical protein
MQKLLIGLLALGSISAFAAVKNITIPAAKVNAFVISVEAEKDLRSSGKGLLSNYYAVFKMKDGRNTKVLIGGEYRWFLGEKEDFSPEDVEKTVANALNSGNPLALRYVGIAGVTQLSVQKKVIAEVLAAGMDVKFDVCSGTEEGETVYQATAFKTDSRWDNSSDCSKYIQPTQLD